MNQTKEKSKKMSGGKRTQLKIGKKIKLRARYFVPIILLACIVLGVLYLRGDLWQHATPIANPKVAALAKLKLPSWVEQDILAKDSDSRRGEYLEDITGIVIHYVGNPGSTAKQNRSYYGNAGTEVNSHFLIGLEGEIIQCLPLEEKSSASSQRNRDTISIEVCHPTEDGTFNNESYASLIKLSAWLCREGGLTPEQIIRHYDVTGKLCPYDYVQHPEKWEQFLADVKAAL